MIFKCKLFLLSILFLNLSCFFEQEPKSKIPETEAAIIRKILRENAIDINDDEWVDSYLRINPFFNEDMSDETYFILLPKTDTNFVCLTDNITELTRISSRFYGIDRNPTAEAETLIIKTDSIIKIQTLGIGSKLKTIPGTIRNLRTWYLSLSSNKIITLPQGIMEITTPPFLYDTTIINFSGNRIDTTTISDTLDRWLQRYFTPYWKNTQVYE